MTKLQEAIGLGLVLGVIHGLVQSVGAVGGSELHTGFNDEPH